jgi:energy-coupling factor transporter transmembrane protein EcfT
VDVYLFTYTDVVHSSILFSILFERSIEITTWKKKKKWFGTAWHLDVTCRTFQLTVHVALRFMGMLVIFNFVTATVDMLRLLCV